MANSLLQNACYLIIFTFCIDQGDGRWRQKDVENLRQDLRLYKRIAEKIEREIEAFYDENREQGPERDTIDTAHYKHATNTSNRYSDVNIVDKTDGGKQNFTYVENKQKITDRIETKEYSNETSNKTDTEVSKENLTWPKFDDILLAIGKKYDWKNDRWIKVKEKLKTPTHTADKIKLNNTNKSNVHVLHKFSYKLVKLNRSKSRRNVIVAVTAVR